MARNMKDSGIEWIGLIPETWEVIRAKNIFTNHKSIVGDKEAEYERLSLTLNGVLKRPKADSKGLQSESFSTYQILNEKELVFKMIDLENISTSRVGYSPYTGIVSPVYIIFNNEKYTRYGYYYFYNMWQRTIFNHLGNNGVRSALNTSDMLNLPFPNISIEEAQRIADFLDEKIEEIDAIIKKTKESVEEYKRYRKTIVIKAVTKGLHSDVVMKETDSDWIGEIPAHWDYVRIQRLFETVDERNDDENALLLSLYTALGVKPRNELEEKGNKATTVINYKKVKKNDVIVNKLLAWMGAIGYSDYEGVTSPDYDVYRAKSGANVVRNYYNEYFRNTCFNGDCYKFGHGIMMMRWRTYPEELLRIKVPNPPLEEQQEIADYLAEKCGDIDALIAKKEAFVEEMEAYKKSLIYEYVTGKKEVL